MSKKKGSRVFRYNSGNSKPLFASQPVPESISQGILIPSYHNSESSVRDNLPGRVLSIHLETPNKVHSLPPILYTAKNAKTVMPEKEQSCKDRSEDAKKVNENEPCQTRRIIAKIF